MELTKELLIGLVQTTTRKWESQNFNSPKGKVTEKARRLQKLCEPFGCQATHMRDLLMELTGESIPEVSAGTADLPVRPFLALVPLRSDNGHNYPIGEVVFMLSNHPNAGGGMGISEKGFLGNTLGTRPGSFRIATNEEIETHIGALVDYYNY